MAQWAVASIHILTSARIEGADNTRPMTHTVARLCARTSRAPRKTQAFFLVWQKRVRHRSRARRTVAISGKTGAPEPPAACSGRLADRYQDRCYDVTARVRETELGRAETDPTRTGLRRFPPSQPASGAPSRRDKDQLHKFARPSCHSLKHLLLPPSSPPRHATHCQPCPKER